MKIKKIISILLSIGSVLDSSAFGTYSTKRVRTESKKVEIVRNNQPRYEPGVVKKSAGALIPLISLIAAGRVATSMSPKTVNVPFNHSKMNADKSTVIDIPSSSLKSLNNVMGLDFFVRKDNATITFSELKRKWGKKLGYSNDNDLDLLQPDDLCAILNSELDSIPTLPWFDGQHYYVLDGNDLENIKFDKNGHLLLAESTIFYDIMPQLIGFFINYLSHLKKMAETNKALEKNATLLDFIDELLKKFSNKDSDNKVKLSFDSLLGMFGKEFASELPILIKMLQLFFNTNFGVTSDTAGIFGKLLLNVADTNVLKLKLQVPIVKALSNKTPISMPKFLASEDISNMDLVLCTVDSFTENQPDDYVELNLLADWQKGNFIYNSYKGSYMRKLATILVGSKNLLRNGLEKCLNKLLEENKLSTLIFDYLISIRHLLAWLSSNNEINIDEFAKEINKSCGKIVEIGDNFKSSLSATQSAIKQFRNYFKNHKF